MLKYEVSESNYAAYNRWQNHMPLTEDMRLLMDVVGGLLDEGIHYSKDLDKAIHERFAFTEEEKQRGKGVEGGTIGMDVYYARHRLEKEREDAADAQAYLELKEKGILSKGYKLGTVELRFKDYRNCKIAAFTEADVTVDGTRGNRRYRATLPMRTFRNKMYPQKLEMV